MRLSRAVVVAVVSLFAGASALGAQEPVRWAELDRALVAADSFAFMMNGQQLGLQVITLEQGADGLRFVETSTLPQVTQTTEVLMSGTVDMRSVRQRGTVAGREMRIDVDYTADRATGSALTPASGNAEVAIDVALPAHVIDDNVLTALLPAIDWGETTDVVVPVFHSGRNAVADMRLRVTGTAAIEAPAGSIAAFRVESSGDEAPLVFFVEAAPPHRLLRIEIPGAPVEVVRLRW